MMKPNTSNMLQLMAIPVNSHLFSKRLYAPKYEVCVQSLKEQQTECCYFCRQQTTSLYVINLDHNYDNNSWQNLALACGFCSYVQLLDFSFYMAAHEQCMIYLPTRTQEELNKHYHDWRCAIKQKQDVFAIQEAIAELMSLEQPLNNALGFQANFKDHLGLLFKPYASAHPLLSHLRWVPSFAFLQNFNFKDIIANAYQTAPFKYESKLMSINSNIQEKNQ